MKVIVELMVAATRVDCVSGWRPNDRETEELKVVDTLFDRVLLSG